MSVGVGVGVDIKCLRCGRRRRRRSSERFSWKKLGTLVNNGTPRSVALKGGKVDGRDGV